MTNFYVALPGTDLYDMEENNLLFHDEYYNCLSRWKDDTGVYPVKQYLEQCREADITDLETAYIMSDEMSYILDQMLLQDAAALYIQQLAKRRAIYYKGEDI